MGKAKNPFKAVVDTVNKAVTDTVSTVATGVNDVGNVVSTGVNNVTGGLNDVLEGTGDTIKRTTEPVTNIANAGFKAVGDTISTVDKGITDYAREVGRWTDSGIMLSPTNAAEEEAKKQNKISQEQADAAVKAQSESDYNIRKSSALNESQSGSKVLLGRKGKRNKGISASSSLGLAKGKTGLQT